MKSLVLTALTGMALTLGAAPADAQVYNRPPTSPYYRPPVSPYLNLLNRSGPVFGYFQGTRPQVDAFRSIGQLQTGLMNVQAGLGQLPGGSADPTLNPGTTGHPVTFFNYSHYYTSPSPRFGPGSVGAAATPNVLGAPPGGVRPPAIGIVISTGIGNDR